MVKLLFVCGHDMQVKGDEEQVRCGCGERRIARVEARAPKFRGHALGPCAQFKNLPAQAVTLKGKSR